MGMITTRDGTRIIYKDWGSGQPMVCTHGWPLNADAWDDQAYFVASGVADKDFSWVHADEEKIRRPIIARLMGLIEADPSPAPHHYDWNYGASVTIVTKSGVTSQFSKPQNLAPVRPNPVWTSSAIHSPPCRRTMS